MPNYLLAERWRETSLRLTPPFLVAYLASTFTLYPDWSEWVASLWWRLSVAVLGPPLAILMLLGTLQAALVVLHERRVERDFERHLREQERQKGEVSG